MPAEQLKVRRVVYLVIEGLNDVKCMCNRMKKHPKYWFCFQESLYLQSFRNKTYKNGLSDIQGTDVPDGVFQHQSGAVMGEGFRP